MTFTVVRAVRGLSRPLRTTGKLQRLVRTSNPKIRGRVDAPFADEVIRLDLGDSRTVPGALE